HRALRARGRVPREGAPAVRGDPEGDLRPERAGRRGRGGTRVTHRLIHASAGTGKTWQLSGRYLELLFAGVEPRAILATTFTRKAAGEIQVRVLERLATA